MNFEKSLEELNKLADQITSGELSLDESIAAFEKSVTLAEQCYKQLNEYKGKLVILRDKMQKMTAENDDE